MKKLLILFIGMMFLASCATTMPQPKSGSWVNMPRNWRQLSSRTNPPPYAGGSLEWTDGMLYPVLQRMEMDGLISSRWRASDGGRPRRYYRITGLGQKELATELAGWRSVWKALNTFSAPVPAED
jgi:DNA-binding HxlR family transcriptional regulator